MFTLLKTALFQSEEFGLFKIRQDFSIEKSLGKKTKALRLLCLSEDSGTEIAFVLDCSGSIGAADFTRAKEFMSNVMKNVWTSCFTVSTFFTFSLSKSF